LGYSLYQEWEQGFSFKLGDTYLVFVQTREGFNATEYHRCRTGLNHFAFRAASRDQVDAITTELRSRGIQILYEDRHPHAGGPETYALYFEDPDRIKVELVAPD
jgi:catechol 2,3-dioxygenase-like lactoylglutathione lyase family enzyme